jgi:predicted O-methyltransferase YrrM
MPSIPHLRLRSRLRRRSLTILQRLGVSLVFNNFHSPIPDLRSLDDSAWRRQTELAGIDLREPEQLGLISQLAELYGAEFNQLPLKEDGGGLSRFYVKNDWFESVDCEMAYSIIRHFKPRRIVEIGSGYSTLLIVQALRVNQREGNGGQILGIDPTPWVPQDGLSDLYSVQVTEVQKVPLSTFSLLSANDILFIDSSHVLKMGSDVQYEYLEVLSRLQPGVIVHVHDIYLPATYPRPVMMDHHHFWNEQDVLQAFLIGNSQYEVLLAAHYLHLHHPQVLADLIPSYDPMDPRFGPSSFWMRRIS